MSLTLVWVVIKMFFSITVNSAFHLNCGLLCDPLSNLINLSDTFDLKLIAKSQINISI